MNSNDFKILSLFILVYDYLWQAILPFIKRHPRIGNTAEKRLNPSYYQPAQIWIQAASAGESKIALTMIKDLPGHEQMKILVTTFTVQGMDILKQKKNLGLNWFPFDQPSSIEKILDNISPACVVMLETEIWPGLFYALKKRKIPIIIINARMSKKSFKRYRLTRFLWSKLCPDKVLAVSSLDAKRFQAIFPESKVEIMPNIKFSYLSSKGNEITQCQATDFLEKSVYQNTQNTKLSVFASIRRQEEHDVVKMIKILLKQYPNQVVALFPRHMHRIKAWQSRLKKAGIFFYIRSELAQGTEEFIKPGQVILWDTFGEMAGIFSKAQVVFMGGSLYPLGGQNFMEPLLAGASTITGPYTDDFSWVGQKIFSSCLVEKASCASHAVELMLSALKGVEKRSEIKKRAEDYTAKFQGGSQIAWQKIMEYKIGEAARFIH